MPHSLPSLPYGFDALEPHIDAQTMQIHHGKHHQAYVTNLNAALDKHPELHERPLEELLGGIESIPEDIRAAVRNHGGGHHNHTLFWTIMSPKGGGEPKGAIGKALDDAFGSFTKFKDAFTQAATTRFGSGWAWLTVSASGALAVESTPNQNSPLMERKVPILGLDVWEHAYYLKYQNRRPEYITAWWSLVNWPEVERRLVQARK